MSEHKNNYITEGSITKALWKFTLPMVAGGILQQCYSIADALVLGNFIGDTAVAAVGASQSILNICFFVIVGLMTGFSIQLSHMFGAKKYKDIQKLVSTTIILLSTATILASFLLIFIKPIAFKLMNTPEEILVDSARYLNVGAAGLIFSFLYNTYSGMLRAVGNSRKSLEALILSSLLNIFLDVTFIAVFGLGIGGAAAATIIAQGISALYLYIYVNRHIDYFKIKVSREYIDMSIFRETITLSVPKILQTCATSVGSMILQSINNYFGVYAVAAISTAYRIDSLTITPIIYMNSAISIFTGQNIGARKPERAKKGLYSGAGMAALFSLAVTTVFVTCGGFLLSLFGLSQQSIDIGRRFFRLCAMFYPVMAVYNAFIGYMQGIKDVKFVSFTAVTVLAVRIAASFILRDIIGSDVIAVAECISWVLGFTMMLCRYIYHQKKHA